MFVPIYHSQKYISDGFSYHIKSHFNIFLRRHPTQHYSRKRLIKEYMKRQQNNKATDKESLFDPLKNEDFEEARFGCHFSTDFSSENSFMVTRMKFEETKDLLFVRSS